MSRGLYPLAADQGLGREGKFLTAWRTGVQRTPLQRAGYRKRDADGWLYLIDPAVWREEVCAGLNATEVARLLADKEHLVRGDGVNLAFSHQSTAFEGKRRFYTVRSSILAK